MAEENRINVRCPSCGNWSMKVKVSGAAEIETNCRSGKCHATFLIVIDDDGTVTTKAVAKPNV